MIFYGGAISKDIDKVSKIVFENSENEKLKKYFNRSHQIK